MIQKHFFDFGYMMTNYFLIGLWDRSCLKVFENLKEFHSLVPFHTHIYPLHINLISFCCSTQK